MPTSLVTLTVLPRLRAAGIKCRVRHQRYISYHPIDAYALLPHRRKDEVSRDVAGHGGETTVDLLFPDGTSYSGTAKCSREDRFNRLEGIRIALGRALAARKGHQHVLKVEAGGFPAV